MPVSIPKNLSAEDLASLRESGLTDKTIRANKLRTENAALLFPYCDLQGNVNGFIRTRPHKPRKDKDGKIVKYEQPAGVGSKAYYPHASVDELREGDGPIYITEGEKKALALDQEGFTAIGLGGVWCWKIKGTEELIDDLAEIDWVGREVYIVFDYDPKYSTQWVVNNARQRLADALLKAGAAEVYNVKLPPADDGGKQGIDDYLVANGKGSLQGLGEQADDGVIKTIKIITTAAPQPSDGVNKTIKIITPVLGEAAYHGLIGKFLRDFSSHTEATEAGMLAHLLPAIGMLAGKGPYIFGGGPQPPRISTVVVGPTNRGRKGTAYQPVKMCMERVDERFWSMQKATGLSSGEGLIEKVADKWEKDEDGNKELVPVEKRLYVIEPEFSSVLVRINREGNVLSQIIRETYDSGDLSTLTVNPRTAFGAHVSIVAHITAEELRERLNTTEMVNGFGNRFLWFYVSSEKMIAHTEPFPEKLFLPFQKRLGTILYLGTGDVSQPIIFEPDAADVWEHIYPRLRDDRDGMAGKLIARAAPMVLRLSLIYCLMDRWKSVKKLPLIGVEHLEAALAVWQYCEESTYQLFGDQGYDPLAARVLNLLAQRPMIKTQLNKHFSAEHKKGLDKTLANLEKTKQIRKVKVGHKGAGRPADRWELNL